MGTGLKGLYSPVAVAFDPSNGDIYVADNGNDRILRYRAPFDHLTSGAPIDPDAVLGRAGFDDLQPPFAPSPANLNGPGAVAFDTAGNLWVADTGYNRVLRYPAAALASSNAKADLVLGQSDLRSGDPNQGSDPTSAGLNAPSGLAFDDAGRLYVADTENDRIMRYSPPFYNGQPGEQFMADPDTSSESGGTEPIPGGMAGPMGISVAGGRLYVSLPLQNRLLIADATGSTAHVISALGQPTLTDVGPNNGTYPRASATGFWNCRGIQVDRQGNVFVADTGNNRVVGFPAGAMAANLVWGQADLVSNGANRPGPDGLNRPRRMVVDYSASPFALYVADTNNHRVLVWKDVNGFHTGQPADLVIGQPDLKSSARNVDSANPTVASSTSLALPTGLAVAADGTLYVADSGNHRVLKYARPVDQVGRIKAAAVLGQRDFISTAPGTAGGSSLNTPTGLALSAAGELFVADTGNCRVLEFQPDPSSGAGAFRVFGQPDFATRTVGNTSVASLNAPRGVAFQNNALYVADTGSNRVVVYGDLSHAPVSGATATLVLGQASFDASDSQTGATGMSSPVDVSVGARGTIAVADRDNHRVLLFPRVSQLPAAGCAASAVIGQADFDTATINGSSIDGLASGSSLLSPGGVFLDRNDTLFVADTQNNRMLHFLRSASLAGASQVSADLPVAPSSRAQFIAPSLELTAQQAAPPLPLTLGGVELIIDGRRAPLAAVNGPMIDMQVPSGIESGAHRIAARAVSSGDLLAGAFFAVSSVAPLLFTREGTSFGLITNSDGTDNSNVNMASAGSVIQALGTGQGSVDPPVSDGESGAGNRTIAAPTSDAESCYQNNQTVCAFIDGVFAPVQDSRLAPGMVGVWQLMIRVPDLPTRRGQRMLRAVINGRSSNVVGVWIK